MVNDRLCRFVLPASLLLAVALVCARPASASVVRHATVERLTEEAGTVIRGRVVEIESRRVDEGRRIVTLVTVSATTLYKGEAHEAVQVVVDGGAHGDLGQRVHGLPSFTEGDDVLLFLERHLAPAPEGGPARFSLLSMGLGAFRIDEGHAVRQVEGLKVVTGPLDVLSPVPPEERFMALSDLERRIREAVLPPELRDGEPGER